MKVAVYSIALNEEQFVQSWVGSALEADVLLIADTGSTDRTVEIAESLGVQVVHIGVSPWRFDTARNASLSALPLDVDYCIALDMDEVLLPGWRAELEKAHALGTTRPRYKYTWSWAEDGSPGLQYGGDKIHTRKGYRWKHPVHEVITPDRIEETQSWIDLEIHHHPDNSKPRSQYLPLLKVAVEEDLSDPRNAHYYARELYFNRRYDEARDEFIRHLNLPGATWKPERAASMQYLAICAPQDAQFWLMKAVDEDPSRREARVKLAEYFYNQKDWDNCYIQVIKALEIKEKPLEYLCEEKAWNWYPYDLAAISAYYSGKKKEALKYGKLALKLNPSDERLKENMKFYQAK